MFKSTIQVTFFSLLGIAINFVTQLLLAYYFGAGSERDAYFAALTIPAYIITLFTGSVGMLLLPHVVKYKANNDKVNQFISAVANNCLLILCGIVLAGYVFADPIMHFFIAESKQNVTELCIYLYRVQMICVFFAVLNSLLSSVFQANSFFLVPAIAPVLTSVTTMAFVWVFAAAMGIKSVAFGNLAGTAISFLFILITITRQRLFRWSSAVLHPGIKTIFQASLPLFAAGIIFRSTTLFERFFAARLPEGSLSYLGNGNQIIIILSTVVSSGIATTSFPLLSKYWYGKDIPALEKAFTKVISLIIMIIFPMIVAFIVCGREIISLLFEHGAFSANDTAALYETLLALMGFFLFSSIGNVSAKMLYLTHNTKVAAVIGTTELLVYIGCALLLKAPLQFVGLAISMSLGAAYNIFVSFAFIKKRIFNINLSGLLRQAGSLFLLSLFTLLIVWLISRNFLEHFYNISKVVITVALVMVLYGAMIYPILKNIIQVPKFKFIKEQL